MKKCKFDMNVPIPHGNHRDKYGISNFPVGGSKFIAIEAATVKYLRNTIRAQAKQKNPGAKFTIRAVTEGGKNGYRIWRTE